MTITLTAESRGELIDKFGGECREFKRVMEAVRNKGGYGPPSKVDLRFVFSSGGWSDREQKENA